MIKMYFCRFWRYNVGMKRNYTKTQLARFDRFCDRHGLQFANLAEYYGALDQFLSED